MSLLDICVCIIFLIIGVNLKNIFSGFSKFEKDILNKLFWYHIAITGIFSFYITSNGGDALHYWEAPLNYSFSEVLHIFEKRSAIGTMYLINFLPSNILGLSFLTGNIIYACLGFLGFLYLFKIVKFLFPPHVALHEFKLFNISLIPWIWFLPNFHFWSSGIGKDTLLFMAIPMFIFALLNIKKYWILLVISTLISIAIRPHILLFLIISFGIGFILDGRLKGYQKVFLFLLFLVGFFSIFNFVMQFIQLDSLESSAISEYASNKSANLNKLKTDSGVDITSYPFALKLATFLYRPLFFDINGIMAVFASIENFILLFYSCFILMKRPFYSFKKGNYLVKGSILFFLIGSVAFSLILGNLGIMLRQKNMLIPWLVIFGIWTLYQFQQRKLEI